MHRKLTISIDADVYRGLLAVVGRGHIGKFLENLARPFVSDDALGAAYAEMAADPLRERDANVWTEALTPDLSDEAW